MMTRKEFLQLLVKGTAASALIARLPFASAAVPDPLKSGNKLLAGIAGK